MKNAKALAEKATQLGATAYANGIKCAPCLDAAMMTEVIALVPITESSVRFLKAWHMGWSTANVKAASAVFNAANHVTDNTPSI